MSKTRVPLTPEQNRVYWQGRILAKLDGINFYTRRDLPGVVDACTHIGKNRKDAEKLVADIDTAFSKLVAFIKE